MKAIVIDDDKLIHSLFSKYAEKSKMVDIIGFYTSAEEALKDNKIKKADLIFLDVEMPGLSGIDFIKTVENLPYVIIVSGKEKYAVDAFDFDVIDYLLKPVEYPRFLKAINKVKEDMDKVNNYDDGIFIKESSSSFIRLSYDEIYFIEALENYVNINTEQGRYTIHFTMKALEKQLPSDIFARVHRSYIVNLKKIRKIEDNYIIINYRGSQKSIPIAKTFREILLNRLKIISK